MGGGRTVTPEHCMRQQQPSDSKKKASYPDLFKLNQLGALEVDRVQDPDEDTEQPAA